MFDIKYKIVGKRTAEFITRDEKVMDGFDVITDLQMIPKLLRSMAVLQGKRKSL